MTDQSALQVRDLLPDGLQLGQTVEEAVRSNRDMGAAKFAWGVIGSEATSALKGVLDLDVFDVVARVWCGAKELHDFADRSKHPAGERSVLYLGEHAFTKTMYPTLAITIGPYKCPPLRFTLELVATIRSIALSICDGCITGLGSGDGDISGRLSYGDIDLTKRQSKKVPLPARVEFKAPGLAII
jgi:hypothetical protein